MLHVALYARAWVEIAANSVATNIPSRVALYARAWVEIDRLKLNAKAYEVALYARAWVEIIGISMP